MGTMALDPTGTVAMSNTTSEEGMEEGIYDVTVSLDGCQGASQMTLKAAGQGMAKVVRAPSRPPIYL